MVGGNLMRSIAAGSVDVTVEVLAVDAVSGLPRTGLTNSDITACYVRTRSAATEITVTSLGSAGAAHSAGGFVEIEADDCPGWYRFDLPDAVCAAGAESVTVILQAEGALLSSVGVQLAGSVAQMATDVHLCKAALVNKRVHTISTGVDEIKDDDDETTLVTMTPSDGGEDVIVITPS